MLLNVLDLALRSLEFKCSNITNKAKHFHKNLGVSLGSSREPLSAVLMSQKEDIIGININTPQSSTAACQPEQTHLRKVIYKMDVLIYAKS